jgi:hypothetical protein
MCCIRSKFLVLNFIENMFFFQGEISKYSVQILPTLMELMVKPENMLNHNLKVIRIYYAVEEIIGVLSKYNLIISHASYRNILDDEHKNSIPDVLRVLFHVHNSTTNTKVRELVLAVYPAIGKYLIKIFSLSSFLKYFSNGYAR